MNSNKFQSVYYSLWEKLLPFMSRTKPGSRFTGYLLVTEFWNLVSKSAPCGPSVFLVLWSESPRLSAFRRRHQPFSLSDIPLLFVLFRISPCTFLGCGYQSILNYPVLQENKKGALCKGRKGFLLSVSDNTTREHWTTDWETLWVQATCIWSISLPPGLTQSLLHDQGTLDGVSGEPSDGMSWVLVGPWLHHYWVPGTVHT